MKSEVIPMFVVGAVAALSSHFGGWEAVGWVVAGIVASKIADIVRDTLGGRS